MKAEVMPLELDSRPHTCEIAGAASATNTRLMFPSGKIRVGGASSWRAYYRAGTSLFALST